VVKTTQTPTEWPSVQSNRSEASPVASKTYPNETASLTETGWATDPRNLAPGTMSPERGLSLCAAQCHRDAMDGMTHTLQKLSPRHHRAVALRVAGESPQAIAETLGVQRRTVYLWFSATRMKAEVERRLQEVDRLVDQLLARDLLGGAADARPEPTSSE
jgi:DNA-directed RNA polymerase specialized sigma24 family protein